MKKILNKWQLEWQFHKDYIVCMPNLYTLTIGFYKFKSFPDEGEMIGKKNYKGFRIMFKIFFPITIYK